MIKGTNLITGAKAGLFTMTVADTTGYFRKKTYTPPIPPKYMSTSFSYTRNKFRWSPKIQSFLKKKKGKESEEKKKPFKIKI